jgi:ribosomal protein S27AE
MPLQMKNKNSLCTNCGTTLIFGKEEDIFEDGWCEKCEETDDFQRLQAWDKILAA